VTSITASRHAYRPRHLRTRDGPWPASLRTYVWGSSISGFGNRMAQTALPLALLAHGEGASSLGIVLGATVLPKLVFLLAGGVAGDRVDRRRVLVGGDAVMATAQVATALLLLRNTGHLYWIAAAQLAYGCANAFATPALTGMVPQLVSKNRLQEANALLRTAGSAAEVVGPAAAAGVAAAVGAEWALLADAATFGVSVLAVLRLPRTHVPAPRSSPVRDIVAGWSAFTSTTWVWLMVASFAVYQATVLPSIFVIGPLITGTRLGTGSWAAILTARSVGCIVGGLALLRWRPRRPLVASCLIILLDLPLLVGLGGAPGTVPLAIAAGLSAAGVTVADTLWESSLQAHIDPAAISRVSSYDWMGSVLMAPLGYVLIGAAVGIAGTPATLALVGGLHLAVHLVLPALRSVRTVARPPVARPHQDESFPALAIQR
jgi:MFS family permease